MQAVIDHAIGQVFADSASMESLARLPDSGKIGFVRLEDGTGRGIWQGFPH